MADVRIHRYRVDPTKLDELLARREKLIAAIRKGHPGLTETRLISLGDDTFVDIWRWGSAEQMQAAFAAASTIPEIPAAMSLTNDGTSEDGEVVDER